MVCGSVIWPHWSGPFCWLTGLDSSNLGWSDFCEKLGWPVACWYVPGWILFHLTLSSSMLNKTHIEISGLPDWEWEPQELRPRSHQNSMSPVLCCVGQRNSTSLDPSSRKTDLTDEMSYNHLKSIQQKLCYVFASAGLNDWWVQCVPEREAWVPAISFFCPFSSFRPTPPCR